MKALLLNRDFKNVLQTIEQSTDHLLVTGRAGTGKSTLLRLLKKTSRKKIVFLAPTGIAALNIQGQTLHSFFHLPPRLVESPALDWPKNAKTIKSIDTLVIDEISMVRADVMDHIDFQLKRVRQSKQLFGGVQVVLFGDLFQLPPVLSGPFEKQYFSKVYPSPYFFDAHCLHSFPAFEFYELQQVHRQSQKFFIQWLEQIRRQRMDEETLDNFNSRVLEPGQSVPDGAIVLSGINAIAENINQKKLSSLETQPKIYKGDFAGDFNRKNIPTEEFLTLKQGAQVMMIRNDSHKRYVNGTIGFVEEMAEKSIKVRIKDKEEEKTVEVEPFTWDLLKYSFNPEKDAIEAKTIGSFTQLPIKLAWAMTIHKSQGKTFDKVHIDLGKGAFEYGQTYVALSRCRTFEGISLRQPLRTEDVFIDERIVDFHQLYFR
jgi:ATP-dependent DNA helicase PIF1